MIATDSPFNISADLDDVSQVYHHTVPILNYDKAQPSLVGTGVFVAVDHQHLVITAAHVFESRFRKVAFGSLGAHGFRIFGADDMKILAAKAQTGAGDSQRAVYKDGLDLAVIEPRDEVLEALQSHYQPFDLRRNQQSAAAEWGVVSGWPARKNKFNAKKRVCNFDTCYHIQCPIVETEKIRGAGWNPDIYVGLSANKGKDFVSATSGERVHLPKLEGLSGAGMWIRSREESAPTSPTWFLAGIAVEDHESKRMLKVIRIEHTWAPLSQGWGLTYKAIT
jgi:hypothetical protein